VCKKIKKGGGAEQYHADKKTKEAVVVAVEACADDTKGQKCYICLEAVHPHTGEGLVRGCACGDRDGVSSPELGVAHVSCLARQAKIAVEEAEENSLGSAAFDERWARWYMCGLCEQTYHGVVRCALGWACWKTYLGRPETDTARQNALNRLAGGLCDANLHEDALPVQEAEVALLWRVNSGGIIVAQGNLAGTYHALGRLEEALKMKRDVYTASLKILGEECEGTLQRANSYAVCLTDLQHYEEARTLLRKTMPGARRVLGESHQLVLMMRCNYGVALYEDPAATLDDIREGVTTLKDVEQTARRMLGGSHPTVVEFERTMRDARAALRAREAQGEAQDAFRTARAKLAQERSQLPPTLADASARPSKEAPPRRETGDDSSLGA